ncbi:MAG: hypothetical protein IPL26_21415 [Leptospiraceae bacterium]|nr:hypothetical protein [Leptospiraceae bacterium]
MSIKLDFLELKRFLKGEKLGFFMPTEIWSVSECVSKSKTYLDRVRILSKTTLVDNKTASAIYDKIEKLAPIVSNLPEDAKTKFSLVCQYFTQTEDEEDDLNSPVGFDDDAEIINLLIESIGSPVELIQL